MSNSHHDALFEEEEQQEICRGIKEAKASIKSAEDTIKVLQDGVPILQKQLADLRKRLKPRTERCQACLGKGGYDERQPTGTERAHFIVRKMCLPCGGTGHWPIPEDL